MSRTAQPKSPMGKLLQLGIGAVCVGILDVMTGASSLAQDCNRFAWQCQGYRGPSGSSVPSPVLPGTQRGQFGGPGDLGSLPGSGSSGRQYSAHYARISGELFPVPAVRLSDVNPAYLRKSVYYSTNEPPGTIVIDAQNHFLYLIRGNSRAIRYGVGVGRQGFGWSGVATVHHKSEWPDWYPPKEMLARQPEIRRQLTELQGGLGMRGGLRNPLGARALYLWEGGKDTLYRIHGTFEPWTIGKNVSSGCIRMINQDVIDLYKRIAVGAKVVVLSSSGG